MSLYHLVYESQAHAPFETAELTTLMQQSRAHNRQVHVTGLLLHTPEGRFLQILEGEKGDVRQLYYQNIQFDHRHYRCQVLGEGGCAARSFADWNMGIRVAQADDLHTLLQTSSRNSPTRYGPKPTVRPELVKLLLDFVAVGNSQTG